MGEFPIFHKFNETLRKKLENKGFEILDSYSCRGWDTNGLLGAFGGIHKGRPDEDDLEESRKFAQKIIDSLQNQN